MGARIITYLVGGLKYTEKMTTHTYIFTSMNHVVLEYAQHHDPKMHRTIAGTNQDVAVMASNLRLIAPGQTHINQSIAEETCLVTGGHPEPNRSALLVIVSTVDLQPHRSESRSELPN
jgi:hypothetical protein